MNRVTATPAALDLLAEGGLVDRLLAERGFVEKLVAEDGTVLAELADDEVVGMPTGGRPVT